MPIDKEFLSQLEKTRVVQKVELKTIKELIIDYLNKRIHIPPYQRSFVWEPDKQCRFIESIFMNIPIPPVFLLSKQSDNSDKPSFELIDGVQRLVTLANFHEGLFKLRGLISLPDLNQATFHSLPSNISEFFLSREIQTVVIQKETHPEIQFEVFARLNQGSVSLNDQELRNCIFHGEFNDFLIHLSQNTIYRKLLSSFTKFKSVIDGKPDKNRMLDVEMILRFFSLQELYGFFKPNEYPLATPEIFNYYMRHHTGKDVHSKLEDIPKLKGQDELEKLFIKCLEGVDSVFHGNQFKRFVVDNDERAIYISGFNKAVFDIQMLGFAEYSSEQIFKHKDIIYDAFLDLSSYNQVMIEATKVWTNQKVNERMNVWKQRLSEIFDEPQSFIEHRKEKINRFNSKPICHNSGHRIETIDESFYEDGHLYHRAFRPITQTLRTRSSSIRFRLEGQNYESDSSSDAWDIVIACMKNIIPSDDAYTIRRLTSLSFIGTQRELSGRNQKETKRFKSLGIDNLENDRLFIEVSGNKNENIQKMEELTSLFSFMNDFEIL